MEIILADDDEDDRYFFSEMIGVLDPAIQLTMVEDGELLIKRLEGITDPPPPHMIFLDINMPKVSGLECLQHIRARKAFCEVPVIMYTTSSSDSDIVESYKCGATLFIRKWYSVEEGVSTLRKIFESYHSKTLMGTPRDKFYIGK